MADRASGRGGAMLARLVLVGVLLVTGACGASRAPARDTFAPVEGLPPVAALSGATLVLTRSGEVYAWGADDTAQVGDAAAENCGNTMNPVPCQPQPHRIAMPVPATAVSAGGDHSLALSADGVVWTWGADHRPGPTTPPGSPKEGCASRSSGSGYGHDATRCLPVPVPVAGLPPVTTIVAGDKTDAAITADGRVWTWGAEIDGPQRCLGGVGADGGAFACSARPHAVVGLPPVAAVSVATTGQVVAVDTAGGVWWWGTGYPGPYPAGTAEFAAPRRLDLPVPVAALVGSTTTVVAVDRDGSAWVWGRPNAYDTRRFPPPPCRPADCITTPVPSLPPGSATGLVPGGSLRVSTPNGTQLSYGPLPSEGYGPPVPGGPPVPADPPMYRGWFLEPPIPGAVTVVGRAGSSSTTVLTDDGRVLARGDNAVGELGP